LADIRVIRRRIRGVQSISKITRAMEMIATSKMRRAQERGLAGRPYSEKIRQVIADLSALRQAGEAQHPLLQRRDVNKILMLMSIAVPPVLSSSRMYQLSLFVSVVRD